MGDSTTITLTPNAKAKVSELLAVDNSKKYLRIYIVGGGCSGFQYSFAFENNKNDLDEVVVCNDSISVVIDPISINYLRGAIVDYIDDLTGSRFRVTNPNATSTCSCGSSFSA